MIKFKIKVVWKGRNAIRQHMRMQLSIGARFLMIGPNYSYIVLV